MQILQQYLLLKVLPAADENKVAARESVPRPDGHFRDHRINTAPFETPGEAANIAAVAVEIQHIRIHVAYLQFHKKAVLSVSDSFPGIRVR